jgi:D-glycero-alpha-D-manno-heptose-7-phosphate kinase
MMGRDVATAATGLSARAPARVSFGGGGTDLAAYYERFGGFVVSMAIDRYARVAVRPSADGATRIYSADFAVTCSAAPDQRLRVEPPLELPKAVLEWFVERGLLSRGVELHLSADAPPGAGLGSSSAMAVAVARALAEHCGQAVTPHQVAELACWAEIERLGMPIGKQDQFASAYGGVNAITFTASGVEVAPLMLPPGVVSRLSQRLLLFETGCTRNSADVLRGQQHDTLTNNAVLATLHELKALAFAIRQALVAGDLDSFGRLLDRGWQMKRTLSTRVSSPQIDAWYAAAREAGALGGKLTGAGGGGFMLLYCAPDQQRQLRATLRANGLREWPFRPDFAGATCDIQTEPLVAAATS